jgi:hypothetical protein
MMSCLINTNLKVFFSGLIQRNTFAPLMALVGVMSLTLDHPFGDFHPVRWMISGWLILADADLL